jgi:hypothetical protein
MQTDNTQYNLRVLKGEIGHYLLKIEDACKKRGVPMSEITLIMRNPDKPEMYVVMSTEGGEGIKTACDLALSQQGVFT